MSALVKVCCRGCMFYQVDPKAGGGGVCRRYPPRCQIVTRLNPLNRSVTEMTTAVILPMVQGEGDWCGEFLSGPPDAIAGGKEDRQVAGGKVKA